MNRLKYEIKIATTDKYETVAQESIVSKGH